MKIGKRNSNTKIKKIGDDIINNFANTLREEKEKDKIKFANLLQSQEFNTILKEILTHAYKKENEIYILNTYLRSLKKFMNIIQFDENETIIENFLSKISSNLQSLFLGQNKMLMRIGDQGDYFYIILQGSVSVLVTKTISIYMSQEQYTEQLKILYNNEPYLYEGTLKLNKKSSYYVNLEEIEFKDPKYILEGKNKVKSLDEYISFMNGEKFIDSSSQFHSEVKLMCYFKVTELTQGNSFGEIALIDSKQKRTASIFCNEDCFFGILSSVAYKKSMKKIQEQIKRENIEFVFNTQLFNQISLKFFTQSYWNYFINRRIQKGDFLFKEGFERDEIYFIQEGEIKINANLNFEKIEKILHCLMPKYKINKEKNIVDKNNEIVICFGKKGQILGLGDLLYKNKFYCNAICDSVNANFFAIDVNIFFSIAKNFQDVLSSFKELEDNKKRIMIRRLKTIKFAFKNSLIGEKVIENGMITKSGKEIKFDDWFDYEKNLILKSSEIKRKKVFVDLDKIKKRNHFNLSLRKDKNKNKIYYNSYRAKNKTFINLDNNNNNNDINKKMMIINIKKGQNIKTNLKKFQSRNPKLILNDNSYNNNTLKTPQKYNTKNIIGNFSDDEVIQNIIFAEKKTVSKMLKNEKQIYNNLFKKVNHNKNYLSIYEKASLLSKRRIQSGILSNKNKFDFPKRILTDYNKENEKSDDKIIYISKFFLTKYD